MSRSSSLSGYATRGLLIASIPSTVTKPATRDADSHSSSRLRTSDAISYCGVSKSTHASTGPLLFIGPLFSLLRHSAVHHLLFVRPRHRVPQSLFSFLVRLKKHRPHPCPEPCRTYPGPSSKLYALPLFPSPLSVNSQPSTLRGSLSQRRPFCPHRAHQRWRGLRWSGSFRQFEGQTK